MQKRYRYNFQKGGLKSICPECGRKTFVRYIDSETGKYCSPEFGRCDREIKCGYHCRPAFEKDHTFKPYKVFAPKPKPQPLTPIPFEVLVETLNDYEQNIFIQNLLQRIAFPFEPCDIESIISLYYLGTVASYGGAVALPYIDIDNNIRAIQVKQFDETNHTVKNKTSFLHSILKYQYLQQSDRLPDWLQNYELNDLKVSCLFGEHLLNKYPFNPIALVEAPKTAIYGTLYFGFPNKSDNFLWLAVYNISSLNVEKCKSLKGRNVVLFPDLSTDGKAFKLWSDRAKELNSKISGARFSVSDLLESHACKTERLKGCDIADYLIGRNWREFREITTSFQPAIEQQALSMSSKVENNNHSIELKSAESAESVESVVKIKHSFQEQSCVLNSKKDWSNNIAELEAYFASIEILPEALKLNNYTTIFNTSHFIDSHIATLKSNNGNPTFISHLIRLQELKEKFSREKQ